MSDDEPPPLDDWGLAPHEESETHSELKSKPLQFDCRPEVLTKDEEERRNGDESVDPGGTLMDEMMRQATVAQERKQRKAAEDRRKQSKAFGSGLKKGFFQNTKPKKESKTDASKKEKKQPKNEEIITITAPKKSADNKPNLRLPEVQEALKSASNLDPSDWMTPELLQKLSKDPRLRLALQNPRFLQAIEELQTNPKKAMEKYKNDADIRTMLVDFMAFMGNHFEDLGKKRGEEEKVMQQKELSDEERRKVMRDAIQGMDHNADEQQQVQNILSDPELQALLSSEQMRKVLMDCQQPGKLQFYMQDANVGPKLRKMINAGLIHVQP